MESNDADDNDDKWNVILIKIIIQLVVIGDYIVVDDVVECVV